MASAGEGCCDEIIYKIDKWQLVLEKGASNWKISDPNKRKNTSDPHIKYDDTIYASFTYQTRNFSIIKRNVSTLRRLLAALLLFKRQYVKN